MVKYELCKIQSFSGGKFETRYGVRCPSGEILSISEKENTAAEFVDMLNEFAVCDCHIHDVLCDFIFESRYK